MNQDSQNVTQHHAGITQKLRRWAISGVFLPTVFLTSCAVDGSHFADTLPFLKAEDTQPQSLPLSASMTVKGKTIHLEVALTKEQQEKGLMYRTSLASDRGMLFVYNPPRQVSFWMKNTLIPLDIVFVRDGQVKFVLHDFPPCTSEPCPGHGPFVPIDQVIELSAGQAAKLGIQAGDDLTVQMRSQTVSQVH